MSDIKGYNVKIEIPICSLDNLLNLVYCDFTDTSLSINLFKEYVKNHVFFMQDDGSVTIVNRRVHDHLVKYLSRHNIHYISSYEYSMDKRRMIMSPFIISGVQRQQGYTVPGDHDGDTDVL